MQFGLTRFRPRKWAFWLMAVVLSFGAFTAVDSPCESFRIVVSNQSRSALANVAVHLTFMHEEDAPALWRGPLAPGRTLAISVHEPSWVIPVAHPFINARVLVRWGAAELGETVMDFNYAWMGAQGHFVVSSGPVGYVVHPAIRSRDSILGSLASLLEGLVEWSRCSWRAPGSRVWE